MGYFGKSAPTVKSLAKDIAKDRANYTELTARLERYREIYGERERAARAAIIANEPESVVAAAEAARDEAKRRIGSFESALVELEAKIAATVKQHDDLVTAELAERIAIEREAKLAAYRDRFDALLSAARELLPVADDMSEVFAAREIADVVRSLLLREFPISLERAEQEARGYISALRSGAIRPKVPAPVAAPAPKPEPIPTRTVVSLCPLKWQDGKEIKRCAHNVKINLPLAAAELALKTGHAIDANSARAKSGSPGLVVPAGPGPYADLTNPDLPQAKPVFGPRDEAAVLSGMRAVLGSN